jgi:hypothetical protein
MRWYCQTCGHHHGHENCTAITHDDGARRCGCTNHGQEDGRTAA